MSIVIKTLNNTRHDIWNDGVTMWVYPDRTHYITLHGTSRAIDLDLITEWCEETFGVPFDRFPSEGVWYRDPNSSDFVFKTKIDAAIFKMRWASY